MFLDDLFLAIPVLFLFIFVYTTVNHKSFAYDWIQTADLWYGSHRSANWATTTDLLWRNVS